MLDLLALPEVLDKHKSIFSNPKHQLFAHFTTNIILNFVLIVERNGLSFIETSALDSTNVETAFHNILTGRSSFGCVVRYLKEFMSIRFLQNLIVEMKLQKVEANYILTSCEFICVHL